jgi:lysophospholipase L1-like esterase
MKKNCLFIILVSLISICKGQPAAQETHLRFDFGSGKTETGYIQVLPDMKYNEERGYGFYNDAAISSVERNGNDALRNDFITGGDPFIFAAHVPEGNYDVIITLGDKEGESLTTIKAESRRLMIERETTAFGEFKDVLFTTNVRYSTVGSDSVRLKPREIGHHNWDPLLTIEFNNRRPCICAVEIVKNSEALTVFLSGNSTVTDQRFEPWAAWGQMLPRFFQPRKIVVANHAESGEALKSFVAENRFAKILATMRQDDYLFIQFAHNDQKPQSTAYVEPFKGYKKYLKQFIDQARQKGAKPVLVTPMYRRNFDAQGRIVNTHGDYPAAMREVASEENVPLIDLFEMSGILFESLGVDGSIKAFVHYPAGTFPGQDKELKDNTHFNNYGAYQMAECIVKGIREKVPGLAKYLVDNLPDYDPAHPDSADDFDLPASPFFEPKK